MVENHRLGRWLVFVNTNCVLCAAMLLSPQSWWVANGFFLPGFAGLIGIFPAESDCRSLLCLRFSHFGSPEACRLFYQEAFRAADCIYPRGRYKSSIRRQQAAPSASSRIGFIRALQCKLRHRNRRLGQQTHILLQRRYIRRQVCPMALRTFSRAAASRCRTDRQPAANRTSTAPRISIPITSSSFLRQKAPQAGIKHASAPALRKHMP